jgi:hypothetical protein
VKAVLAHNGGVYDIVGARNYATGAGDVAGAVIDGAMCVGISRDPQQSAGCVTALSSSQVCHVDGERELDPLRAVESFVDPVECDVLPILVFTLRFELHVETQEVASYVVKRYSELLRARLAYHMLGGRNVATAVPHEEERGAGAVVSIDILVSVFK